MGIGTVIVLLICIPLSFGGAIILTKERRNLKELLGFTPKIFQLQVCFLFVLIIFSLFLLVFTINVHKGLIEFSFNPKWGLIAKGFLSCISESFLEEFFFRILIFLAIISISKSQVFAIILSSVLFSGFHFPKDLIQFISYFMGGLVYSYSFVKFQSILIPITIHTWWNFIQGYIFGFSVSGNQQLGLLDLEISKDNIWNGEPQGPEGALVGLAIRLIIILFIFMFNPRLKNNNFLRTNFRFDFQ